MKKLFLLSIAISILLLTSCKKKNSNIKVVEVSKIEITNTPEEDMSIGETLQLNFLITPTEASEDRIDWTSSDNSIASVNEKGLLTAIAAGKTKISVKTSNNKTASFELTVIPNGIPVKTMKFTLNKYDIQLGEKLLIEMEFLPANATDKTIRWQSSDKSVATVETFIEEDLTINAFIKTFKLGTCTLTATSSNNITSTCEITVSEKTIEVESITVNQEAYSIKVGESIDLGITVSPANATDKSYSFSTWDKTIIGFENEKLKGLKAGETYFSITANDGSYSGTGTIKITVIEDVAEIECIDPNGRKYDTVTIGEQIWTSENYAYLPTLSTEDDMSESEARYYVYQYEGNNIAEAIATDNYKTYGVLYNYKAAMDNAPEGWHLPTNKEWKTLEIFLGMTEEEAEGTKERGNIASKFKSNTLWNPVGTNESGFNALPAGLRTKKNVWEGESWLAMFWTATPEEGYETWAFSRRFVDYQETIDAKTRSKQEAYSVRYIKDK